MVKGPDSRSGCDHWREIGRARRRITQLSKHSVQCRKRDFGGRRDLDANCLAVRPEIDHQPGLDPTASGTALVRSTRQAVVRRNRPAVPERDFEIRLLHVCPIGYAVMTTRSSGTSSGSTKTSQSKIATPHPTGFWSEEFVTPHRTFIEAGLTVTVASPSGVTPTGRSVELQLELQQPRCE
jgi:hypothetical protein